MPERTILSLAEVSALTGVTVETLRFWRKRGAGGPASYKIGRRVVYDRDVLDAWLDDQRRQGVGGSAA